MARSAPRREDTRRGGLAAVPEVQPLHVQHGGGSGKKQEEEERGRGGGEGGVGGYSMFMNGRGRMAIVL